ncbi:MAG TPA: helix-turn-helix domain-containing protein [Nocardioidaceae bacterium]|nr:helix-turn-helix domain-containing protein [Nocardioidaceae bacterium]
MSAQSAVDKQTNAEQSAAEKPLRADAQRNRDKILDAARAVFRERGAACSLDEIAKRAGVGAGTLYRHFPTRDDLIDAVMRNWADRIEADCQAVVDSDLPPRTALTEWFNRFVENVGIYQGAAAKLMSAMDDPSSPIYRKCQVLVAANAKVLDSVRAKGALRDDVDAREVMRLVSGVASVADSSRLAPDQAGPMLAIVLEGILKPDAS